MSQDGAPWYAGGVTRPRPVPRDARPEGGWPIVVMRGPRADAVVPQRTPVTHAYAALAFSTGGRSRVELNGEWRIGPGDVLLVPAGTPHRTLEGSGEFWGAAFCVPCFAADGAASLLEPFERVRDGSAAVVRVPAERRAYLETLFRELEAAGRSAARGESLDAVRRSLLTLILAEVDRARVDRGRRQAGRSVVTDALRFIERNCLRRLTLAEVAAAVGRSPTYVTAALSEATGRSAGGWITAGRMAEARRLLLHSTEKIEVIAGRVGYADPTHFIRTFRREHGATPAAWRASQAGGGRDG
jgi:AraC-like DNA-binding protein